MVSVAREVIRLREASGEAADRERARALLEELRRRTRETLLWAEIERRRDAQKLEVEIEPEPPEAR